MAKKTKINFSSKQNKKARTKKNIVILMVLIVAILVGVKIVEATTSYISEKKQEKIELQQKAEAERIAAEKKRKEEEEAKKRMIGVNQDGKKYTYDAIKVAEKLRNFDYANNGEKIVFLTFDDGASTTVTPQILDVLKENDVRATFFVSGANIERGGDVAKDIIKESFEYGNAIANHSYSHDYKYLYPNKTLNLENFNSDFDKTDELLKEILGPYFSTRVIRCPGGFMSWKGMDVLQKYLDENNMASIDWNAINADSQGRKKVASELVQEAIETSQGKEMVVLLMHDTYGKEETAKALSEIIKYYKDNGYTFKTLS